MQTFLPLEDFAASARVLDRQRLGKQRVECLQILKALANPTYGWQNHPAVQMWRSFELGLIEYGVAICDEWIMRGYADSCKNQIDDFTDRFTESQWYPWWLGDPRLHLSHQSNLLRKAPWAYGHLWPDVPRDLEYWWPTKEGQ
jgi:hypothetical protein